MKILQAWALEKDGELYNDCSHTKIPNLYDYRKNAVMQLNYHRLFKHKPVKVEIRRVGK